MNLIEKAKLHHFLYKCDLLSIFLENFKKFSLNRENYNDFLDKVSAQDVIVLGFPWGDSRQGEIFWVKVSTLWKQHLIIGTNDNDFKKFEEQLKLHIQIRRTT